MDAAQEHAKSWIGSQLVEGRFDIDFGELHIPTVEGLFESADGEILTVQSCVDHS